VPLTYVLPFTLLHLRATLRFSRLLLPAPLLAPAPLPPMPMSVSTVVAQHDVRPERPTILWPLCRPASLQPSGSRCQSSIMTFIW